MKYAVTDIAKYVIDYCAKAKSPVTNLKLQGLLYFLWVEYYKLTKSYLYKEELKAWPFGPAADDVYYYYCPYGGMPIDDEEYIIVLHPDDKKIIDAILTQYKDITTGKLIEMTHEAGSPWDVIYNMGSGREKKIPFDIIVANEKILNTGKIRSGILKNSFCRDSLDR